MTYQIAMDENGSLWAAVSGGDGWERLPLYGAGCLSRPPADCPVPRPKWAVDYYLCTDAGIRLAEVLG